MKRKSNEADDIAALLQWVIEGDQEVEGLTAVDHKGRWTPAKLRAYMLERLDRFLDPPVETSIFDEAERRKLVYEARVDLAYHQYQSVKIWIHDSKYNGSRTVYIDNLEAVKTALGRDPVKGDGIQITNVRRLESIRTPGPSKKRTWHNQMVADVYVH